MLLAMLFELKLVGIIMRVPVDRFDHEPAEEVDIGEVPNIDANLLALWTDDSSPRKAEVESLANCAELWNSVNAVRRVLSSGTGRGEVEEVLRLKSFKSELLESTFKAVE